MRRSAGVVVATVLLAGWVGSAASAQPAHDDVLPSYLHQPFFVTAPQEPAVDLDLGPGYPTQARVIGTEKSPDFFAVPYGDGQPWDVPLQPEDPEHTLAEELALLAQWWPSATVYAKGPLVVAPTPDELTTQLTDAGITVTEEGWVHPLPNGRFVSAFGPRAAIPGVIGASFHNGVDIAAPLGYPIRAASSGTVVYVGNGSRQYGLSGWVVAVDHGDGIVTTYNHMARPGVLVRVGDEVRAGQIIALIGSEGRSSGPHLHFGVHIDGRGVDPVVFMRSRGVDLRSGRTITPVPLTADWLAAQETYRLLARAGIPTPSPVAPTPAPSPTDPSPSPSLGDPSPTPSPGDPSPGDPSPSPSVPSPSPGDPSPSPGDPAPTPEDPTPTPSDPAPTPEDPSPTPSDPAPTPEDPSPTPSDPGPTPEDPSPTPSDPSPEPAAPSPEPSSEATPSEPAPEPSN